MGQIVIKETLSQKLDTPSAVIDADHMTNS